MEFKSILKPDGSIALGLATVITTWAIYERSLPDIATMHATDANDINIEAGRKKATLTAAALLGTVTLLTRDINVWILGGAALFAFDANARVANHSNPDTGKLVTDTGYAPGLRSVS